MILGALELGSIAAGFEVLDVTVKAAMVSIIMAEPVYPGKFLILFTGDVASVTASVQKGKEMANGFLVDQLIIPNLHRQVELLLMGEKIDASREVVGILEGYTALSAIRASDIACKVSDVKMLDMKLANEIGGKSFFLISGSIEDVEASIEAAAKEEQRRGFLLKRVVIPNPHPDIQGYLGVKNGIK